MTTIYIVESHTTKYNLFDIETKTKSLHAFLTRKCASDYVRDYQRSAGEVLEIREIPIK